MLQQAIHMVTIVLERVNGNRASELMIFTVSLAQNDVYVIFCPLAFDRNLLVLIHAWMCVTNESRLINSRASEKCMWHLIARNYFGYLGVGGRIILKSDLSKQCLD
jgi:hypothetical protein